MKSQHIAIRSIVLGAGLGSLVSLTGCGLWSGNTASKDKQPWSISKMFKKEYQKPQSLAAIWSPDVLAVAGKPPTRGFGGRLYFYNERSQAIPVEGELIVHGYEGSHGDRSRKVEADKTFAFTQEQLTGHFSPSELGASYSVWIPWEADGGFRKEITLIPTFKGTDGSLVQGSPSKVNLPGRNPNPDSRREGASNDRGTPSQRVSYTQRSTPTNPGFPLPGAGRHAGYIDQSGEPLRMRTTTIEIPPTASIGKQDAQPTRQQRKSFTLGASSTSNGEAQRPGNRLPQAARDGLGSPSYQTTGKPTQGMPNTLIPSDRKIGIESETPENLNPATGIRTQQGLSPSSSRMPAAQPALPPAIPPNSTKVQGVSPSPYQLKGLTPPTSNGPVAGSPRGRADNGVQPASFQR